MNKKKVIFSVLISLIVIFFLFVTFVLSYIPVNYWSLNSNVLNQDYLVKDIISSKNASLNNGAKVVYARGEYPQIPEILNVTVSFGTRVMINWKVINFSNTNYNQKGFKIYRSSGLNSSFVSIAKVLSNQNYYIENTVSNYTYYYAVSSYDGFLESDLSNIVNFTSIYPDPLVGSPKDFSASAISSQKIGLTWSD